MNFHKLKSLNLWIMIAGDGGLVALSYLCAYLIRFDLIIPELYFHFFLISVPWIVLLKLLGFYFFDLYRGMWRYTSIYDLVNIEGGRPYDETGDRSIIGDGAWINHGATMHGCEIGDGAAIGINAALDYHCQIGEGAIVANGTACPVGFVLPANCIAEGVPAAVVKSDITDGQRQEWLGRPREEGSHSRASIAAAGKSAEEEVAREAGRAGSL